MVQKRKEHEFLNSFIDSYIHTFDMEKEKLSLQCEIIAVYTQLSLSTTVFKRNIDMRFFQENLFHNIVVPTFAEYLYKSRTQILARGIREIYKVDIYTLKTLKERLYDFMRHQEKEEKDSNNLKTKPNNNQEDFVDYWTNIIDKKGK